MRGELDSFLLSSIGPLKELHFLSFKDSLTFWIREAPFSSLDICFMTTIRLSHGDIDATGKLDLDQVVWANDFEYFI